MFEEIVMVWARKRLTIAEDLFLPVKVLTVNYSGPNPQKFYGQVQGLLKKIFNVPEGYIQEHSYTWETKGDQSKFKVGWIVTKPMDVYTFLEVAVNLKGSNVKDQGSATIEIDPLLKTEYPQDSIWEQNIIYEMIRRFWHAMYYQRKIDEYLDASRRLCTSFETQLKHYAQELRHESTE